MRPESLYFLFSPITRIKGVGGATSAALERLLPSATALGGGVPIVRDLLFHLPAGLIDRRFTCALDAAPKEGIGTFVVQVDEHVPPASRHSKKPFRVLCSNETGEMTLAFFNASGDYIKQSLPVGQKRVVSGRFEHFDGHLQMVHPDVIAPVSQLAQVQKPDAVYPLTAGLTSKRIAKIVEDALAKLPKLPEWLLPEMVARYGWPAWKEALNAAHHPELEGELFPSAPARVRLAYDEMLAHQLHLALLRSSMAQSHGEVIDNAGELVAQLRKALPFRLTHGQEQVLRDIGHDMASGKRMTRLLQGDVGSGKTVVALLAMLSVVEQGGQAALMVPTEIIAQQHYETLIRLLGPLKLRVALLTGSVKGKARQTILADLQTGTLPIIVGTHALFQEKVEFKNLLLAVIDEQHRFGVEQRMALTAKGQGPHLLHMTATPIPRSLTMTLYGDMDSSLLTEKPAGRKAITTRLIPLSRYEEIMERLSAALARGEKVYWICPLIEGGVTSDEQLAENDIAAAQTRYTEFKARFGNKVGLVHGRMKHDERDRVMHDFTQGKFRLLVATTVVEVGVDVRDATIMVIEKAERFGLSQLHQLRGRVGRGDKASACVLLYSDNVAGVAQQRLGIMRDSEDGFVIAEADLMLRGGGDVLGTRQSGMPLSIFTNLREHHELLVQARDDASTQVASDPQLNTPRGQALRLLLELFGWQNESELGSAA